MPCTRVTEGLGPVPDPKYVINQGREKETFPGGAQRDSQKGKPRYDLIPPLALRRVADLYTKGAEYYGDRNWEKGMKFSRFFGSLLRHAYQFALGEKDEDHLAAVVFNALAIMHFQETDRTDLNDLPSCNTTGPMVKSKEPTAGHWSGCPCPACCERRKNLEKPLTSEPPLATISKSSNPGCQCGEHFERLCPHCTAEKPHPQEED